jgi:hypothetical protein
MTVLLSEARTALGYRDTEIQDDPLIQAYIDGIEPGVADYLDTIITQRAVTDDLYLNYQAEFWLTKTPVVSLTSLISYDGLITWDTTKLTVRPSGQVTTLPRFSPGPWGNFVATYQAGYSTTPPNIKRGEIIVLQYVWEAQRGTGSAVRGVVGQDETGYNPDTLEYAIRRARSFFGDHGSGFA